METGIEVETGSVAELGQSCVMQLCSCLCGGNLRLQNCRDSKDLCELPESMAVFCWNHQLIQSFLARTEFQGCATSRKSQCSQEVVRLLQWLSPFFLAFKIMSFYIKDKTQEVSSGVCRVAVSFLFILLILPRKLMVNTPTCMDSVDLCRMHSTREISLGIHGDSQWEFWGYCRYSLRAFSPD